MTTQELIQNQLRKQNLDIRATNNARFMDQKVTPDVLTFIADCIVNFVAGDLKKEFTKNDIWHSDYFKKNVKIIYSKPEADNETVQHEFDKFTAQPIKTLAYSGILQEENRGNANYYVVKNADLLEYVSLSDRKALEFLSVYIQEVMGASGFLSRLEDYKSKYEARQLSANDFREVKDAFEKFIIGNTPIQGETEVRRIFPKVFNVYAVTYGLPGSESGRMTDHPFYSSDLMYNRVNFRDINKEKGLSRGEAASITQHKEEYSNYEMKKAMDAIRKRHAPNSEVRDQYARGEATQVHHIFSKSTHPHLRATLENLILLTPQQHNTLAHPGNKTSSVDPAYQLICLGAKVDSVESSVRSDDAFYSKESLIDVINLGLDAKLTIASDFQGIRNRLLSFDSQLTG